MFGLNEVPNECKRREEVDTDLSHQATVKLPAKQCKFLVKC